MAIKDTSTYAGATWDEDTELPFLEVITQQLKAMGFKNASRSSAKTLVVRWAAREFGFNPDTKTIERPVTNLVELPEAA